MGKKQLASALIMLFLLTWTYQVAAENITVDKKVFEKILNHQKTLENEIEQLKQHLKENPASLTVPAEQSQTEDVQYLKEDVEEISKRLDKVETRSILDKIQLGGELKTQLESFRYKNIELNGVKTDQNTDEIWSNRLRISLRSEISDNIIFNGRLGYFKLWGDTDFGKGSSDWNHPSVPDPEGNLHIERAYIDYFVGQTPLSLTFGRLPTTEGPPSEFRNYSSRKATWPKLMLDAETDGIIANLSFDQWTGLKNSMFRAGYSKLKQNFLEYQGVELEDLNGWAIAFETEIPGIKNSFLWLSYILCNNVFALTDVPESAPFQISEYPDSESVGDLGIYTLHLQFSNIKNSGLDWFGSLAYIDIDADSEGSVLTVNIPGVGEVFYNEVGLFGDRLNGDLGHDRNGYHFYTGISYRLPFKCLKYPKLGFEYNHGSKYWIGEVSSGSGDLINKLGINGDAYEFYYIQPIDEKHMFCRIGALYLDYDYYNPLNIYGNQVKSDMALTSFYLLTDIKF
ncbi:MAG: DUF3373 family protein [Desulfobacterales bacterium]|nr:DUF3373 family protein [Desulfobacterales bacterium]